MVVKVLFVCMGNICRSPTAEGVFRHRVEQQGLTTHISIDSAGTHAYHIGEPPDTRSQQSAQRRGLDLSTLRARQVELRDFMNFDYVLAMDEENHSGLLEICPKPLGHKVQLFLQYAPHTNEINVPDPYYGGAAGFERVLDLVEAASQGFITHLRHTHSI